VRKELLPYNLPFVGDAEITAVSEVLRSGWLTTGARARELEQRVTQLTGTRHAVAVNSCTAGLHLALVALGIGPGDEVIVPDMTFCATANAVIHAGARPVIVDVERDSYQIDPRAVEKAITPRTRAILPVHYGGQACDMDAILSIARGGRLFVVEDGAHALGAEYKGRRVGEMGDVASFSFHATKNVTAGEGGVVTTNDQRLSERIRRLALHGLSRDAWNRYAAQGTWQYQVTECGYKYNLTDIAAALAVCQLERLDFFQRRRAELARLFTESLAKLPGLTTRRVRPESSHMWHLFVVEVDPVAAGLTRDALVAELRARNIATSVHFIPLHQHPAYSAYVAGKDFPRAEAIFGRIVSLPLYPKMSDEDARDVIEALSDAVRQRRCAERPC